MAEQKTTTNKRIYLCTVVGAEGTETRTHFVRATTRAAAENWLARKLLAEQMKKITARTAVVDDFIDGIAVCETTEATTGPTATN